MSITLKRAISTLVFLAGTASSTLADDFNTRFDGNTVKAWSNIWPGDADEVYQLKDASETTTGIEFVDIRQETLNGRVVAVLNSPRGDGASNLLQYADIRQETLDGRAAAMQLPTSEIMTAWSHSTPALPSLSREVASWIDGASDYDAMFRPGFLE